MATSGSYNFSVNRNDLIKGALQDLGVLAAGETIRSDELDDCTMMLNLVVKSLQGEGMQLWAKQTATLFLEKGEEEYALSTTGDPATTSYQSTTIRVAAAAIDTIIEVVLTTGMTVADHVGIELDDGRLYWATVGSITDGNTFVLGGAGGLPGTAAVGNKVYWFTNKIPRPLRIVDASLRDLSTNVDYKLRQIDRLEYWGNYDKFISGDPTEFYYDPQRASGTLIFNYQPDDVDHAMVFTFHRPFEDFDSATDEPDFPQEWFLPVRTALAIRLGPSYGVTDRHLDRLAAMYATELDRAKRLTNDAPRTVIPTRF